MEGTGRFKLAQKGRIWRCERREATSTSSEIMKPFCKSNSSSLAEKLPESNERELLLQGKET
jgi:hypothetical protein